MKINRLLRASYPQREFQMPTGSISVKWLLAFPHSLHAGISYAASTNAFEKFGGGKKIGEL